MYKSKWIERCFWTCHLDGMSVDNNGIPKTMKWKCGPWARYLTDTHPLVSVRPCGDCMSGRTGPWFDFNEAWECWWSIACTPTYMIEPAIRAIILGIFLFRLWYLQCKDADHTNVKTPSRNIIKSSKETTLVGWTLEFWTFFGDGNSNYWCTGRKKSNSFCRFLRNRSLKLLWRVRGRRTGIEGFEDLDGSADAEKTGEKPAKRDGHLP